jgi:hypothetical protein
LIRPCASVMPGISRARRMGGCAEDSMKNKKAAHCRAAFAIQWRA